MKQTVRGFLVLGVGLAGIAALDGCIFKSETTPPAPPRTTYVSNTAPESLVVNLEVSYRRREIEEYADLLSDDFRFRLTQTDANDFGQDFFTFEEDSSGTEALFSTPEVNGITIDLPNSGATVPTEIDIPAGSLKIRVQRTQLEVDTVDGTTFLVTSIQDMFFREGDDSLGEDPERWYLFEWREFPGTGAVSPPRLDTQSASEDPIRVTSLGALLMEAKRTQLR